MPDLPTTAVEITRAVRAGEVSAVDVLDAHLAAVDAREGEINAFNLVLAEEARAAAAAVAARVAAGDDPGPLAGVPLALTPKEFAVLEYLMTRPGRVVSAEELLEHVWDEHADPFTNTVRVTVGTLRRKLVAGGEAQLIDTVIGRGYRLSASADADEVPDP